VIAPRTLGATGLRVSGLCLGTWQLSGAWGPDTEPAVRAIRRAFDLGINFFDTAYAYGEGAAESGLARGLGDLVRTHRDELVLVTKAGLERRGDVFPRNSDPAWLRTSLLRSLDALGVDHVDVLLVHWPDPLVPYAETAGVLAGFVEEGLVRHTGVSNFGVPELSEFARGGPLEVAQPPLNLLSRDADADVIPFCAARGVGIMGWGALAQGLLTDAARDIARRRADRMPYRGAALDRALGVVDRLAERAAGRGCTLAELALAWVLAHPAGIVPIVGAQNPAQIESSVRALDLRLDPGERDELTALAAEAPAQEPDPPVPTRAEV